MYRYLIILEKGAEGFGAYAPDLPGCVAVGRSEGEVKLKMQEAIEMHLEGMLEDHEPIPTPHSTADYLDIILPNSAA